MKSYRHPRSRAIMALAAALLALAVRVLVPAGFMIGPAHAEGGFVEITLCSQSGMRQAWLAPDGSLVESAALPPAGDGDTTNHADCAFAGQALAIASVALQLEAVEQSAPAPAPVPASIDLAPGRGLAAPPPPATAPPVLI